MAAFDIRPGARADTDLLIGLAGGTGSGKTYTGMRICTGIVGPDGRFLVIDTENGRANHYADFFAFDHLRLDPPFSPARYAEAIQYGASKGYRAMLVDSMSHEYAGEGGVLEMQEAEFKRLGGGDNVKLLSWAEPKQQHKRMMYRLLQVHGCHLVLCFRAESKIDMKRINGRTEVVEKEGLTGVKGWFPVTEKNLAYELTTSVLLLAEAPGIPVPIKLQMQHKHLFPPDQVITEDTGAAIAAWAAGGNVDWIARIRSTWTAGELQNIASQLKNARLDADALAAARAAWKDQYDTVAARQREARGGAQP